MVASSKPCVVPEGKWCEAEGKADSSRYSSVVCVVIGSFFAGRIWSLSLHTLCDAAPIADVGSQQKRGVGNRNTRLRCNINIKIVWKEGVMEMC